MKTFDELKALIEKRGVHSEFGEPGEGWGIEQSPHELAVFLVRMQQIGVTSVLEIGTGYKGGLSRFLAQDMGWDVTTVDVKNYGHAFEGVHYVIAHDWVFPSIGLSHDLVFIDGAHDFEHVTTDFQWYGRYAKKVVALHDIAGLRNCDAVRIMWQSVNDNPAENWTVREIIADKKQSGIGWIER